ncbi:TetR/AcrR family transcriptional regulator [Mycobacterium shigaense]|uniref:Putative transcriptional regulator, TetR n=1 Tax=Mycobacterium shigaense TaxID=722731 RepID=A0A1Z4ELR9_9MYCO|nr:TetR/AcrR family transcriptional regulator [Mycobacterium shigaense]MEA1121028.1 TetR/AcrR family transcriptional regulator [Mycobacterium shigaense]PRI14610.1 TetR family transcriptional regulator [Mycobacterium shigaense]BAX93870.1 putative transcriptional regulator, TetR [Mycobacterium shigaense]
MRPRTIDDGELLDMLLSAFADLGYEGTSVRALCRHLGVSHSMIHHRYQSKEQAWYAAVDHAFGRLNAQLTEDLPDAEPLEILREVMTRFAKETIERPALARIIHAEAARPGPRFDYLFDAYMLPIQQRVATGLRTLQKEGIVRSGPVDVAFLFTTTWGLGGLAASREVVERAASRRTNHFKSAELTIDIIISGLAARCGSA